MIKAFSFLYKRDNIVYNVFFSNYKICDSNIFPKRFMWMSVNKDISPLITALL